MAKSSEEISKNSANSGMRSISSNSNGAFNSLLDLINFVNSLETDSEYATSMKEALLQLLQYISNNIDGYSIGDMDYGDYDVETANNAYRLGGIPASEWATQNYVRQYHKSQEDSLKDYIDTQDEGVLEEAQNKIATALTNLKLSDYIKDVDVQAGNIVYSDLEQADLTEFLDNSKALDVADTYLHEHIVKLYAQDEYLHNHILQLYRNDQFLNGLIANAYQAMAAKSIIMEDAVLHYTIVENNTYNVSSAANLTQKVYDGTNVTSVDVYAFSKDLNYMVAAVTLDNNTKAIESNVITSKGFINSSNTGAITGQYRYPLNDFGISGNVKDIAFGLPGYDNLTSQCLLYVLTDENLYILKYQLTNNGQITPYTYMPLSSLMVNNLTNVTSQTLTNGRIVTANANPNICFIFTIWNGVSTEYPSGTTKGSYVLLNNGSVQDGMFNNTLDLYQGYKAEFTCDDRGITFWNNRNQGSLIRVIEISTNYGFETTYKSFGSSIAGASGFGCTVVLRNRGIAIQIQQAGTGITQVDVIDYTTNTIQKTMTKQFSYNSNSVEPYGYMGTVDSTGSYICIPSKVLSGNTVGYNALLFKIEDILNENLDNTVILDTVSKQPANGECSISRNGKAILYGKRYSLSSTDTFYFANDISGQTKIAGISYNGEYYTK